MLSSCVTQKQMEYGQVFAKHEPIEFENEDLNARLSFPSINYVNLLVKNNTDSVLTLIVDLASFTTSAGQNDKFVTGETRVLDSNKSQPVITIPPKSNFNKDFYLANSNNWVPNTLKGSSFVFGYQINSNERYIIFSGDQVNSILPKKDEVLGTVSVKKQFWNVLFASRVESRRKQLYDLAIQEATTKYGSAVRLQNLVYEGKWSGLSLILYFSMLSFVEDASLTADVVR